MLPLIGSQRVRHEGATEQQQQHVFIYLACWVLAAAHRTFSLPVHTGPLAVACKLFCHAGFSSLTKLQTGVPCIGSVETELLKGSPNKMHFDKVLCSLKS